MSNFAKIDKDNIVTQVIVAEQDFIDSGVVGDLSEWIETNNDNKFRGHYACIGDIYDKTNDVFISPQPFPSWALDASFDWQPPVEYPGGDTAYKWNEDTQAWDEYKKYTWNEDTQAWDETE